MSEKAIIQSNYAMNEWVIEAYLSDLTDADLLIRPFPTQNHIAWQLGHLILSEKGMLDGVKPGSSPELPPEFEAAHGRDEAATKCDDPAKFRGKAEYLKLMKAQRDASKAALEAASEADLDAPSPERLRQMAPTVGSVYMLMSSHVTLHAGQFVSVRRKLEKPVSF